MYLLCVIFVDTAILLCGAELPVLIGTCLAIYQYKTCLSILESVLLHGPHINLDRQRIKYRAQWEKSLTYLGISHAYS